MKEILLRKRGLGNSLSKPFGIMIGVLGLGLIIRGVNVYGWILAIIFILVGVIYAFGKEMTEINLNNNTINSYSQLFLFKFGNKKELPKTEYILVRDLNSSANYSSLSNVDSQYEISLVTKQQKKLIIAYRDRKTNAVSLIRGLVNNMDVQVRDKTKEKILKTNCRSSAGADLQSVPIK
jgi:membrane-bound ClpP family serine protease